MSRIKCYYKWSRPLALAALVAIVLSGWLPGESQAGAGSSEVKVGKPPFPEGASLSDVAEGSVSGVVNISTTRVARFGRRGGSPFNDPFFDYFFGPGMSRRMPRQQRTTSLGSGVIISDEGLVLTNNHVVDGAEGIRVTLFDEREFDAELLGADPKTDVAVLQLKGDLKDLRPLPVGDSDGLRLGETVIAIGNPFGLGHTVTSGIVSAKGRANMGIADYEDFIQTDAAINPGNSGGALLNARGQLVGVNTAIASHSGGYQGIGFAIPSNMALDILNSIRDRGRVVRGWLGVAIQDLDDDLAEGLGLEKVQGVLVSDVTEGSPAALAGLKRGDVVVKIDGERVRSSARLRNLVAFKGAGREVAVTVVRNGKSKTVEVTLREQPSEFTAGAGKAEKNGALEGLTVSELTNELGRKYDLPKKLKGVVVTAVEDGSVAQSGGMREGDVILQLNRMEVTSTEEFRAVYQKNPSKVFLLIYRDGYTRYGMFSR